MLARREFLCAAAATPFAFGAPAKGPRQCIVIVLTGGASQLDTWDPKPEAPSEIRGPFRPIRTNVPGIRISEVFPRMAKHADKFALCRSVYSDALPNHEDGMFLIDRATEGFVNASWNNARQLIETGTRCVRVNMFETIYQRVTWDSHGARPFSTIQDYKDTVGPAFDLAWSSLLEDLHQRGMLDSTLVVALGEFGRTPRINPMGGRDHWPLCQTVLLAGGGIPGGQIIGSSHATGAEPKDNPIALTTLLAKIRNAGQSAL